MATKSQQSPINIVKPIQAEIGAALSIHWPTDGHAIQGSVVPGHHGLMVEFSPDQRHYVELEGTRYYVKQFHFHHPSEHWVSDQQYTMELHVVHQSSTSDNLAVIGIFIEPSDTKKDDKHAAELLRRVKAVTTNGAEGPETPIKTYPAAFLPANITNFYRYNGSLTTPPYSENVKWVVMAEPLEVSTDLLKEIIPDFGEPARFPQPINRRFVLASFDPETSNGRADTGKKQKKNSKRK